MRMKELKRYDKQVALVFAALSGLFLILAFTNEAFFTWAFERHQNQLSWYLRPLFLIPFCYAAFRRSWAGISITVFLLLTSMFWFPQPDVVSEQVKQFLELEMEYLTGEWTVGKIALSALVPISLVALAAAFWRRSLWLGLSVLVFIALAKIAWSVLYAGEAGTSIIVPALLGLLIGIVVIYRGIR